MAHPSPSAWQKRFRAGGLYLASFLASTAISHAQSSSNAKPDKQPLCSTSFALADTAVYVALHAKSSTSKKAQTLVRIRPPLKAQSIASDDLIDMPLLPDLKLLWNLGAHHIPVSVTGTLTISEGIRPALPRPTGCSIYSGGTLVKGPLQMKGVDNIAHNKPFCDVKLYGTKMKQVAANAEYSVRLHSPYDDDLLTFTFDTSALSAFMTRAQQTSKTLTADWASGKCKPILPTPVGSPCFITTAACDVVGLEDDCWELRQLRAFRDVWLLKQNGGAADVAAYYEKAPEMCEVLSQNLQGRRALLRLYWTRIVPCAAASTLGFNRLTRRWYTQMMADLETWRARQDGAI